MVLCCSPPTSFFFLFLCMACRVPAHFANEEVHAALSLNQLELLATDLRCKDYRLVRPAPEDGDFQVQEDLCPGIIPSLVTTLVELNAATDNFFKVGGLAARVMLLCTTNQPEHRDMIGNTNSLGSSATTAKSMHGTLLALITNGLDRVKRDEVEVNIHDDVMHAMGNAAEAIWILSFNHRHNHAKFVEENAVDILQNVIVSCDSSGRGKLVHCSPRTIMWSIAALQNLAASYCKTESGYCDWQWIPLADESYELEIEEPKLLVDGQPVRLAILNNETVVEELVNLVCDGPVNTPHGWVAAVDDGIQERQDTYQLYAWPSRGRLRQSLEDQFIGDEYAPSIIPWAAAGLLKKLALGGQEAREQILEYDGLEECLCRMARSPDWLEDIKAHQALDNLGLDMEDCPPLYEECMNSQGWAEEESKDDCQAYEDNNWCVEFGHLADSNGKAVSAACCACGGGYLEENEKGGVEEACLAVHNEQTASID